MPTQVEPFRHPVQHVGVVDPGGSKLQMPLTLPTLHAAPCESAEWKQTPLFAHTSVVHGLPSSQLPQALPAEPHCAVLWLPRGMQLVPVQQPEQQVGCVPD
jgi:hypothetical protein